MDKTIIIYTFNIFEFLRTVYISFKDVCRKLFLIFDKRSSNFLNKLTIFSLCMDISYYINGIFVTNYAQCLFAFWSITSILCENVKSILTHILWKLMNLSIKLLASWIIVIIFHYWIFTLLSRKTVRTLRPWSTSPHYETGLPFFWMKTKIWQHLWLAITCWLNRFAFKVFQWINLVMYLWFKMCSIVLQLYILITILRETFFVWNADTRK